MDQEDREIAKQLEDQEMVNRKFADRVAEWFDAIGTTPNRLSAWRVILSGPVALCFYIAADHARDAQTRTWLTALVGGSVLYLWCALCDFFDGSLARYQTRRYRIKGLTEDEEYALSF